MTKSTVEKILSDIPFAIHERALLRYMGYAGPVKKTDEERRGIMDMVHRYSHVIKPKGIYGLFPFQASNDAIVLTGQDLQFHSNFLVRTFGPSGTLGIFVVTAGDEIAEISSSLMQEKRLSEALVLDAAASAAVEQAARYVHYEIQRLLGARLVRYSPGYDERRYDWSLSEQQVIFELLIPERIGIRLTPGFTMMPVKSISAAAGKRYYLYSNGHCKF
jgi:cobalamin-dependent methionine synthase I